MTILEEIRQTIEAGRPRFVEGLISRALEEGISSSSILEDAMLPAMRNAGERYRENIDDIPRILAAARCMRLGLGMLEPYFQRQDNYHAVGKVILGTVEGDLHDVGKNLVAIMFRSAGFHVVDLGVDISPRQFLEALRANPDASIVCLSSLLSTSLDEMRQAVRTLREAKDVPPVKIMVGGGSVTQEFAQEIGADAYTENAVDAAEIAKTFFI